MTMAGARALAAQIGDRVKYMREAVLSQGESQ